MTKESDKLPAIAGIAQAWPRDGTYFRHRGYYCGIFDDNVHGSLLWYGEHSPLIGKPKRAPTWSWASVDGKILFISCDLVSGALLPIMEVISLDCKCGRELDGHFLYTSYYIRMIAPIGDGLETGFVEKSKRFYSTPTDGPRHVICLQYQSNPVVGWAIFDCVVRDGKFRCVQIAAKSTKAEPEALLSLL
jgi:hypothetical protein